MKGKQKIAVLGAGDGGHAMSADLTLRRYDVHLFEFEKFKRNILPIQESGGIRMEGAAGKGFARISKTTMDMKEAVEDVDVINIVVPAYAHTAIFKTLIPYLEDGQIVVIWTDNWGTIRLMCYLKEKRVKKKVKVAGTMSLPYACRRMNRPAYIWVRRGTGGMPIATIPAKDTNNVINTLRPMFKVIPATNVLETSINNPNFIGHIPMMILNAASIERTKGDYNIFRTIPSIPPSQRKLENALREERAAVCKALKIKDYFMEPPVAAFRSEPAEPPNDEAYWHMTETLNYRYLTEDVPYSLVTISSLGDVLGVPTYAMKACIKIASIILEADLWKEGLTADKLGFEGLSADEIIKLVTEF